MAFAAIAWATYANVRAQNAEDRLSIYEDRAKDDAIVSSAKLLTDSELDALDSKILGSGTPKA